MKKLLIIPLLLLCTLVQSQNYNKRYSQKAAADYFYTAFNFDVNLAFELIDKAQGSPDIGVRFKGEGSAGFKYKFDI